MRSSRVLSALALGVLAAGCDSNPTSPEVSIDAALTQMATAGIASYSTATLGAAGGIAVAVPVPATAGSSACPYSASTKFFVCAPVTLSGLTFNRQFQLLDATGNPLSAPNGLALASIRSVIDVEGTLTTQGPNAATIQIDRHEDAVLSGIQSANRLLNGTSTQALTVTGSSFSFTSNDASTTTNLQLPSHPDQKYPLGGTIVTNRTLTSSGVTSSTLQQRVEMSFDGTSIMTVKMSTTGTATTTCRIDMAGVAAPACS